MEMTCTAHAVIESFSVPVFDDDGEERGITIMAAKRSRTSSKGSAKKRTTNSIGHYFLSRFAVVESYYGSFEGPSRVERFVSKSHKIVKVTVWSKLRHVVSMQVTETDNDHFRGKRIRGQKIG